MARDRGSLEFGWADWSREGKYSLITLNDNAVSAGGIVIEKTPVRT